MRTKTMTQPKTATVSGEDSLRDAMQLIDGLTFDSVRGGVARSDNLFISVVPDWENESRETYQANVMCLAMWHKKVSWELMRVSARPQQISGFFVQHVLPLSASGHAKFEGLGVGTYVLRAYCRVAQFTAPELHQNFDASRVALAAYPSGQSESEPLTRRISATDDIVVLIGKRGAFVTIVFATNTEQYAGKTLDFCVVDPHSKEIYGEPVNAILSGSPLEGEFRYRSNLTELSLTAGNDVEVSYRIT